MKSKVLDFFTPKKSDLAIPFMESQISAGFPSPADDFQSEKISLDEYVVKNKDSTFYARARGISMVYAGIDEGDILIIDRSLDIVNGRKAVCFVDGDFTLKKVVIEKDCAWLIAYNDEFPPIKVTEENDFLVWGILTFIVKKML